MKDTMMEQGIGATAFDLPVNQHPFPRFKPYYGNQSVPHPTNNAAKITPKEEAMRMVLDAK